MATESEGIVARSEPTRIGGICYRDEVIRALLERRLVVFAGAGVSMDPPTCLPNFEGLIREFEVLTGQERERQESSDNYLGRLKSEKVDVHAQVLHQLSRPEPRPNPNHSNLLRLFGSSSDVRLVTTNFDMMFEEAAKSLGWQPKVYTAPALPQARDFRGIVHLHGSIEEEELMVLTKGDFGRAYFQPGWATTFLAELVQEFTVLFVGYSGNDLLPDYLLTAVSETSASSLYMLRQRNDEPIDSQSSIELIEYESKSRDDHSSLSWSLRRLGEIFHLDIREWREAIKAAAAGPGLERASDEEIIRIALRRLDTTRYFAEAANDVSRVRWLEDEGYLTPVFNEGALTPTDEILAGLVVRLCIREEPAYLVEMIERHRCVMSDHLWQQLALAIDRNALGEVSLVQWLTILLQHPIEHMEGFALSSLAKACRDREDSEALLLFFEFLVRPRRVGKHHGWAGIDEYVKITEDTVSQDSSSLALHHCANMFDDQSESILKRGLEIGIRSFEQRHQLLKAWGEATDDCDRWSTVFNPFDPQVAPNQPEGFDLLFNVVRQQIRSLVKSGGDYADDLVQRLASSPVPILRRLSVDAFLARQDVDAENKAAWVMEETRVRDVEVRSETTRLLKQIFPQLRADTQSRLVEWLMSSEDEPDREEEDIRRSMAYWLTTLTSADPHSTAVAREIEKRKGLDPDALSNPHPERIVTISGPGLIDHPKPVPVDQLLSKRATEWVKVLTAWRYPGQWLWSDERRGLRDLVQQACVREFRWGKDLAVGLIDRGDESTDLWQAILMAWGDDGSHVGDWSSVLDALNFIKARDDLSSDIANALVKFAKEAQGSDLFERASQLATDMWRENSDDAEGWLKSGLLYASWNSAAGQVPMYWVEVAKRLIDGSVESERVTTELKAEISEIVHPGSQQSTVGKVTLGAWFHVFYQLDEDWAQEALVPMFGQTHIGFEAAWEGFLWTFQGTLWLPDAMLDHVEAAIANRSQINTQHGVSVARLVSFLCCTGGPEPAHHLFKALITTAPDLQSRSHDVADFVIGVRSLLRRMDVQERAKVWNRWLRPHLERRKVGIPRGLVDGEVWELLSLIPVMLPATREIVDVVLDLPIDEAETSNFTMIFYKVDVNDFPKEYARLMLYFDRYELSWREWNDNKEHLDKLIANEAVPPNLRKKLEGLKLKHEIG